MQWFRLLTPTSEHTGSIPGQETRSHIPRGVAKQNKTNPNNHITCFLRDSSHITPFSIKVYNPGAFMTFTKLPKCYHYLNHFHHPKRKALTPFAVPSHSSSLLATTHWLSVSRYDWAFHINGIIQNMASCVWLISFSIRFSRFTHVTACIGTSFFFFPQIIFLCMDLLHFIYSFISSWSNGQLGCFHFLSVVNNAVRNIYIRGIRWLYVFSSLGYMSRSGMAGSLGKSV